MEGGVRPVVVLVKTREAVRLVVDADKEVIEVVVDNDENVVVLLVCAEIIETLVDIAATS